jgi:hypothetical protein
MAITPRSKGLGNIGAIVDRQGRASPAAPVKPTSVSKPKIAAPVKPGPRPVVRTPAAKVAPKPAPKLAPTPKPSPFSKKPDTRAPGGGGMNIDGNPIGGGMGAQMNIARPGQGNLARNTGPGNGGPQLIGGPVDKPIFGGPPRNDLILPPFKMPTPGNGGAPKPQPQPGREGELAEMPDDLYNSMMAYNKSRDDQMQAAKAAGDPYWFAIPESADIKPWTQWQMDYYERKNPSLPPPTNTGTGPGTPYDPYMPPPPVPYTPDGGMNSNPYMPPTDQEPFGYQYNGPPPMDPGYGGPYTPRPDMGPGVGFGVGLPQPGFGPGTGLYRGPIPGAPDYAFGGPQIDEFTPPYQPPMAQPGGPFGQLNQQLGNTFVDMFTRRLPEMYGNTPPNTMVPPGSPDYAYNGDTGQAELQPNFGSNFGAPTPNNPSFLNRSQVFNQRGNLGNKPQGLQSAFSPQGNNNSGGFMGGGSGSLFGGGGFAGK